jgi:hypothetical protein
VAFCVFLKSDKKAYPRVIKITKKVALVSGKKYKKHRIRNQRRQLRTAR